MKRVLAMVVVASLVGAGVPAAAQSDPAFRASIDSAIKKGATDARALQMAGTGGGGGGGKWIVMSLLTTAVTVGTYYLLIKKTNETLKQQQPQSLR